MVGLFKRKLEKVSKEIFEKYPDALSELEGISHGVYALYDENELYYVGKTSDLKRRIRQHLKDRHFAQWTHFSLYLMSKSAYIGDIESVLIHIANPRGNRAKPKGRANAKLRKELEEIVKKKQEEERNRLFGTKRSKKKTKTRKKQPTSNILKNKFSKARPLSIRSRNKEHKASLLTSGKIRYAGKLYNSPSGAAEAALGGSKNGWDYWYVQNEDGNWVKLSTLR